MHSNNTFSGKAFKHLAGKHDQSTHGRRNLHSTVYAALEGLKEGVAYVDPDPSPEIANLINRMKEIKNSVGETLRSQEQELANMERDLNSVLEKMNDNSRQFGKVYNALKKLDSTSDAYIQKNAELNEIEKQIDQLTDTRDELLMALANKKHVAKNAQAVINAEIRKQLFQHENPLKVAPRSNWTSFGVKGGAQDVIQEFSKMLNGNNVDRDEVLLDFSDTGRSSFIDLKNMIRLADQDMTAGGVIAHEFGHWYENSSKGVQEKAVKFLDKRRTSKKLAPIKFFIPGSTYDASEVGYADHFIHPYTGKMYSDGATEIVSTGFEYMWNDPIDFAERDQDHFEFIVDIMKNGGG